MRTRHFVLAENNGVVRSEGGAIGAGTPALVDCVIDPSDGTESGRIGHLNPKGLAGSH